MAELKTEIEKRRDERNGRICSEFKKLKEKDTSLSTHRIASHLAEKYNLTAQSVTLIVKAANLC